MSNRTDSLWGDFHQATLDTQTCRAQLRALHRLRSDARATGSDMLDVERLLAAKRVELDMLEAVRNRSFAEIIDFLSGECNRTPQRTPSL
ncbi:hypothetical protein FHP25_36820 [Vineibacter terrae]|uniref:Uncharacterized protein n=1 Tax=Vineibacter terrae TaxID=2586908 RepID=A0A5C8P876_9HYPH|nr:hypothetical protein [Vineibacter terrae]TXL69969.1 hypothetical protein FHP25_36820 [Vineibacter terrae]